MKLATNYTRHRRKLNKLLPFPGKKIPRYPNLNVPNIERDLEKFEKLLNMFGFYPENSGISEIGTYTEDYLQLSLNEQGDLDVNVTLSPLLFPNSSVPLRLSYSFTIQNDRRYGFMSEFLYCFFSKKSVDQFPLWERYYDLQFNAMVGYTMFHNYKIDDELFERQKEEEKIRNRESALLQLMS